MAEEPASRRPTRRCTAGRGSRQNMPSAVHYLGYVEEDETPEMIMKKFEELEKVRAAAEAAAERPDALDGTDPAAKAMDAAVGAERRAGGGAAGELTEAQLLELFKQTSHFNVRSVLAGNEALLVARGGAAAEADRCWSEDEWSDEEGLWADVKDFWIDGEEGESGGPGGRRAHKARRRAERAARGPRPPTRARSELVTHYNTLTQALIRRRVRPVDPDAIAHIKVPDGPLPPSWGRAVALLRGAAPKNAPAPMPRDENAAGNGAVVAAGYVETRDVLGYHFRGMRDFQGVLINLGWEGGEGAPGGCGPDRLSRLPLGALCPLGFLFLWAPKAHLAGAVARLSAQGFAYVENLTWVWLAPNNTVLTLPAPVAQRSHLTLLIFRREGLGKHIELRHQRNPDVLFDCMRNSEGQACGVPEGAYITIETLLPTGRGAFLELWAARGVRRAGWAHVVQLPP